jgi:hypothetical protein
LCAAPLIQITNKFFFLMASTSVHLRYTNVQKSYLANLDLQNNEKDVCV